MIDNFGLVIDYESNNTLEFELFRKTILEKALHDFRDKSFNLQHNEFFSVENLSQFELLEKLSSMGAVYSTRPNSFIIARQDSYINMMIISRENKKILNCIIYAGGGAAIKNAIRDIRSNFNMIVDNKCNINVRWYYMQERRRVDYTTIPETIDDSVLPESYPYIEDLDAYVKAYLKSTEPVLVLVGTTGTGKTKILRHIVREIAKNIVEKRKAKTPTSLSHDPYEVDEDALTPTFSYTNDVKAISNDEIFVDFLSDGNISGLILEDMDNTLKPREDGNDVMSKLLSASDGFITNYNKKILVTTNIASINTIDEAFRRPGRCFDLVKTRKLNIEEAVNLLKVLTPDKWEHVYNNMSDSEYSLAEIYKLVKDDKIQHRTHKIMGFR